MQRLSEKRNCEWCGKTYDTYCSTQRWCCAECRQQFIYADKKSMRLLYTDEDHKRECDVAKKWYANNKKVKRYCKDCGELLPHGKQQFCLDCLLRGFMRNDYTYRMRLRNRGYNTIDAWLAIKERGLQ